MSDVIRIAGIRLHGYHGCTESELKVGQVFDIAVELRGDFSIAAKTDDLRHATDYDKVVWLIENQFNAKRCDLIEAVAERIAQGILSHFPIREVIVKVGKPELHLGESGAKAEVEISRGRED